MLPSIMILSQTWEKLVFRLPVHKASIPQYTDAKLEATRMSLDAFVTEDTG